MIPEPPFGHDDIEVLEREPAYQGFFQLDVVRLRHRLYAGGWSGVMQRELFVRPPAVVLLPYDPVRDQVVCIEQFRPGALDMPYSPWLLELVAGLMEPGESPEQVARREADEEAGLQIGELELIHRYQVSPGANTEEVLIFCGRVDASDAGGLHGLEAEHEDIRVRVLSWDDAHAALRGGRIRNAATLIALQWLALERDALRARWQ